MGKTYDRHRYEIITKYSDLGEGSTRSGEVCPACEGGSTKETSLSVSRRDGVLLWNCHRASCPFRGSDQAPEGEGSKPRESGGSTFDVQTSPVNTATLKLLAGKYRIPIEDLELAGLRWSGDGDGAYERRVCFPIINPMARVRGTSYRSYQGAKPKNIIRLNSPDEIACSWYKWRRSSKSLVLVEDQISAIRLARHVDAMALLGTNLSDAKIQEILNNNPQYQVIHLSLDPDAVGEAIKTQLRLTRREILPNLRITPIERDIKDMDAEEFDRYIRRVTS